MASGPGKDFRKDLPVAPVCPSKGCCRRCIPYILSLSRRHTQQAESTSHIPAAGHLKHSTIPPFPPETPPPHPSLPPTYTSHESSLLVLLLALPSLPSADARELGLVHGHPQVGEGTELLQLLRDRHKLHGLLPLRQGLDGARLLHSRAALRRGAVAGLGLLDSAHGEDDELGLVLLQALHVRLQGFHGQVGAAVVDGDPDRLGVALSDARLLQLLILIEVRE